MPNTRVPEDSKWLAMNPAANEAETQNHIVRNKVGEPVTLDQSVAPQSAKAAETTAAADPFAWYEEQKAALEAYARQQKQNVETSQSPADEPSSPYTTIFYMDKAPIPTRFGKITEVTFSQSKTEKYESRTVQYSYAARLSNTECRIAENHYVYTDTTTEDLVLGISCTDTETGEAVSANTSSAAVYLDQIHAAIEVIKK